jgi:hypothetical protein
VPYPLYIVQVLVSELAQQEADLIKPGQTIPIWSPYDAFEAANTRARSSARDSKSKQ